MLVLFCGLMCLKASIDYNYFGDTPYVPIMLAACAVLGIVWVLWTYVRFTLADNYLVIKQPFRGARSIDLQN